MSAFLAKEFELPKCSTDSYKDRILVLQEMQNFEQRYKNYIVDIRTSYSSYLILVQYYIDYDNEKKSNKLKNVYNDLYK